MVASKSHAEQAAAEMADECLAMRARMIGRTITAIYDSALRETGATAGQVNILAVVLRKGPISPGDVAAFLNIEKSTMSRNADRMKQNGWLEGNLGASAREQELSITRAGRRLLERAAPKWREAQKRASDALGRVGVRAIHEAADAIRERKAE